MYLLTYAKPTPTPWNKGKLVGQVSRRDVMRAVVKLLEPTQDHQTALLYLSALRDAGDAPIE